MKSSGIAAVILIIILSTVVQAQEDTRDSDNLKSAIFRELTHNYQPLEYNTRLLYEDDDLSVQLREVASRTLLEFTPKRIPGVPRLIFSGTLNDPQLMSPAYENVGIGPRNSLNIDLVTGKYYWEW